MVNEYKLEIYKKPLEAIKNGYKRIEIRTNNSYEDIDYKELNYGDIISFQIINGPPFINLDVIIPDALKVKVISVKNYKDPKELLIHEGLEVLSTLVGSLEEGIDLLYSFHEYKEMIPLHGIFAIEIETI
ncbi:MAG: hypothetical protein CL493_02580 [Actinobacteria bacterium]|mgnify:FL=1|nr:hypothetical protein [Actinomycetota bacterium]|tara:strand:- start:84 stop:473 length:390 start_codon:yes stop_codon:yes gene_type:complete